MSDPGPLSTPSPAHPAYIWRRDACRVVVMTSSTVATRPATGSWGLPTRAHQLSKSRIRPIGARILESLYRSSIDPAHRQTVSAVLAAVPGATRPRSSPIISERKPPSTHRRTTIITHEVPEAGPYPGSDAGPAFRNDNDPTATTDRLRQAWEAGAHDITMTFSDSAYQRPPAPGHVDH